jgi:hypothetical protein
MKFVIALFALSLGTAAIAGSPSASASLKASEESESQAGCPPPVFECCDGTIGSGPFCASHGGKCAVISICGEPV